MSAESRFCCLDQMQGALLKLWAMLTPQARVQSIVEVQCLALLQVFLNMFWCEGRSCFVQQIVLWWQIV